MGRKGQIAWNKGKKGLFKHSEQHKANLRIKYLGDNNPCWRGNKIGRAGVHYWVRKYLPRPDKCEICKIKDPIDISNISKRFNRETYTRDFKNWKWVCRSCHWKYDEKVKNTKGGNKFRDSKTGRFMPNPLNKTLLQI